MSYAWLMAPHEYEPDYDAYINEMYSLEEAMIDVATYDDWFPNITRIEWRECIDALDSQSHQTA